MPGLAEEPPSAPARSPLLAATVEEGDEINGPGSQLRHCLEPRALQPLPASPGPQGSGQGPQPRWGPTDPAASRSPSSQAVTIITYKEPENPEYRPFLARLKEEALAHFNFSMKDGLVGHGGMELGKLGGTGGAGAAEGRGMELGTWDGAGDKGWSWSC